MEQTQTKVVILKQEHGQQTEEFANKINASLDKIHKENKVYSMPIVLPTMGGGNLEGKMIVLIQYQIKIEPADNIMIVGLANSILERLEYGNKDHNRAVIIERITDFFNL